jgi:hypothetical protein
MKRTWMLNSIITGYGFQFSYKCVRFKQQVYFNLYAIHHIQHELLTTLPEESNIVKLQNYKEHQNYKSE